MNTLSADHVEFCTNKLHHHQCFNSGWKIWLMDGRQHRMWFLMKVNFLLVFLLKPYGKDSFFHLPSSPRVALGHISQSGGCNLRHQAHSYILKEFLSLISRVFSTYDTHLSKGISDLRQYGTQKFFKILRNVTFQFNGLKSQGVYWNFFCQMKEQQWTTPKGPENCVFSCFPLFPLF